ncbi:hypothetical protein BJV82DRAFT_663597 [Fennellomyces sp. T-0311]|nr:hypothetical protein BJV82DRAFT_663597 [Fennellomyces sp. T-0311]
MHSFIFTLPPETLALILSNLAQRDQVESMRVCRSWYNAIPDHVSEAWNTLRIAHDSWPTMNDGMTRCLAHHTGCQLTFLNVTSRVSQSDGFGKLISAVIAFGNTLKELTINNMCTTVMDEHELLDRYEDRPIKLVYLHLDNAFICEHRQKRVLARSPDLEMLATSIHQSRIVSNVYIPEMDFISMIDTCPRLQYISWKENEHPNHSTWLPWSEPIKRPQTIFRTLQYLKLVGLKYSSSPISSIQFPRLSALCLSDQLLPTSQWLSFLCGCPDLESLELELLLDDFAEPKQSSKASIRSSGCKDQV